MSQVVIPESAIYTTSPVEVFKAESVVRLGAAIAAGDQQHRLSCLGQPQHGLETVRLAYCGSGSGLVPTKDEASGRKTQSTGRGPTQTGFRKGQIDLDPPRNRPDSRAGTEIARHGEEGIQTEIAVQNVTASKV